jgi:NAD(P)-dependent dehydrogenase (short-subunit alcohol dehydrogenase family)
MTPYTLITGASSGLGRSIALRLASNRRVILNGRNSERLQETLASCKNPDQHLIWEYDLDDVENLGDSLAKLITERDIAIESFVHAAGILKILPVRSATFKTMQQVLNTNLVSAFEVVSLLSRRRVNQQQLKTVVFISSIASAFGAPGFSMYAASKSALDGLMRSLAVELAPGVRVNSVLPGGFRTPMTEAMLNDPIVEQKLVRDYPLGLGRAEDVVDAVDFLISERSRWITGQQFVVDGGRSINISI